MISISTTGPWQKVTRQLALTATSFPQVDHGVLAVGHVLSTVRLPQASDKGRAPMPALCHQPLSQLSKQARPLTATSERCKTGVLTTTFGTKLDPGGRGVQKPLVLARRGFLHRPVVL